MKTTINLEILPGSTGSNTFYLISFISKKESQRNILFLKDSNNDKTHLATQSVGILLNLFVDLHRQRLFLISGLSHKIQPRPELKQATQGLCWRQARSNLKLIIAFHQSFHQKNTRSRVGTYLTSSLISQLIDVYCWTI